MSALTQKRARIVADRIIEAARRAAVSLPGGTLQRANWTGVRVPLAVTRLDADDYATHAALIHGKLPMGWSATLDASALPPMLDVRRRL